MNDRICMICQSSAVRKHISQVENIWPGARLVNFCETCQVYYLDDMPTDPELLDYYKNDYYLFPFYLDLIKRAFRRSRSASQYRYIQDVVRLRDGKVLEVGACDGMLLRHFARENAVIGLELSDRYRQQAMTRYDIRLLDERFDSFEGRYDLLIMSHALEHFPDIHGTVEKCARLLNPGGYFFVELPNSPLPGDLDAGGIKNYLHGAHTFNFTVNSLRRLMEGGHGFEIVSLDRFTYDLPGFMPEERKRKLGAILIGGHSFSAEYALDILYYLTKILVRPESGFRRLGSLAEGYEGPGDMIRMVARLKP